MVAYWRISTTKICVLCPIICRIRLSRQKWQSEVLLGLPFSRSLTQGSYFLPGEGSHTVLEDTGLDADRALGLAGDLPTS